MWRYGMSNATRRNSDKVPTQCGMPRDFCLNHNFCAADAPRHEILFHPTYRVPTLGLRAYRSDGSPISLDVAEACLKLWYALRASGKLRCCIHSPHSSLRACHEQEA